MKICDGQGQHEVDYLQTEWEHELWTDVWGGQNLVDSTALATQPTLLLSLAHDPQNTLLSTFLQSAHTNTTQFSS